MPLALCPISPIGLVVACYWLPESPRWLIWNNRMDEAWDVIQKVHHDVDDDRDTAAHAEFLQIKAQVEHDKQYEASYWHMFTVPSWRRRTLLGTLVIFAVQSAGINGITTYLILVAQSVGFTGSKALLIYGIYVIIAVGFNFVNAVVIDKVGRRPLLREYQIPPESGPTVTNTLFPNSDGTLLVLGMSPCSLSPDLEVCRNNKLCGK